MERAGLDRLLLQVAKVEVALLILIVALVMGSALWRLAQRRRIRSRVERGWSVLTTLLDRPGLDGDDLRWLAALSLRLRIRLFVDFVSNLDGVQRRRAAEAARLAGLFEWAEARCRSRLWWRRLRGARLLSLLGGGEGVVPALLRDPHPAVRAQAAEWATDHPGPEVADTLLELLGDEEMLPRFTVQDSLLRMGAEALGPLHRYLSTHQGEGLESALSIAAGIAEPRLLPTAVELARDPSPGVRSRSAAVLGALGGEEGVGVLEKLLADPVPEVRGSAARALGKLAHWPAAPRIAGLLRDGEWPVRREAGLALRMLGGPGTMMLRRYLNDDDHFASDMARRALDLPDPVELMG